MEPPLQFKHTPLFGGALTASLPATFTDVSTLRQVPDNQEVFLDSNGFTSVTIDLCERVESPPQSCSSTTAPSPTPPPSPSSSSGGASTSSRSDHAVLLHHFFDIVAAEDTKRILRTTHHSLTHRFPAATPVSESLAVTTPPPPPPSLEGKARPNEAKWVGVLMTLIRLVKAQTDMLVVVNVPCVPGQDGGEEEEEEDGEGEEVVDFERGVYGRRVEEGRAVMERVVGSLRVVDWGLFGDEGGAGG